jgi:hypothetical protein
MSSARLRWLPWLGKGGWDLGWIDSISCSLLRFTASVKSLIDLAGATRCTRITIKTFHFCSHTMTRPPSDDGLTAAA